MVDEDMMVDTSSRRTPDTALPIKTKANKPIYCMVHLGKRILKFALISGAGSCISGLHLGYGLVPLCQTHSLCIGVLDLSKVTMQELAPGPHGTATVCQVSSQRHRDYLGRRSEWASEWVSHLGNSNLNVHLPPASVSVPDNIQMKYANSFISDGDYDGVECRGRAV